MPTNHGPLKFPSLQFSLAVGALAAWGLPILICCTGCSTLGNSRADIANKSDSAAFVENARNARQAKNLTKAFDWFERAIRADPSNSEIRREFAELLAASGDRSSAILQLRDADDRNPNDTQSRVLLAKLLFETGKPAEAELFLEAVLAVDPENTDGLMLLAERAELRGNHQLALETYHQVLGHAPDNVPARMQIAAIHLQSQQPSQAAPLLRTIYKSPHATEAERTEAKWKLGVCHSQEGRWTDAAEFLSESAPLRSTTTADDWYLLAYAWNQIGNVQAARNALTRALELTPNHANSMRLANGLGRDTPVAKPGVLPVGYSILGEADALR